MLAVMMKKSELNDDYSISTTILKLSNYVNNTNISLITIILIMLTHPGKLGVHKGILSAGFSSNSREQRVEKERNSRFVFQIS